MVKERFTAQLVQSRDASPPSWYGQDLMGIAEVTEQVQGGVRVREMHHHNPPHDLKSIRLPPQSGDGVTSCLRACKQINAIFQL